MIPRYTNERMGEIWSEQNKYASWLKVELAACESWSKLGRIPAEALAEIKQKAAFDIQRIDEIERQVRHDLIAFVTSVAESIGENGRYVHLGLTSYDVVDTALSLRMRDAAEIILESLEKLQRALKQRALEHKHTVMMGRTHGIHAELTTFGLKVALWFDEVRRNIKRLKAAKDSISVGKLSGAVGTYSNIDPRVEKMVCEQLSLNVAPVSTQILQRDRHAEMLSVLAIIAGTLEKIGVEMRNLQRTEIREVQEHFAKGQKGSSAMPHKKNPIICERISGLARVIRGYAVSGYENMALWHERDLTNSSVERIIIPDSFILCDYMLSKMIGVIENMVVFPENMRKNIELTGRVVFSQTVLCRMAEKGLSREDAYRLVQRNALQVYDGAKNDLQQALAEDEDVLKTLSKQEIADCFSEERLLAHVDEIFERVGIA